MLFKLKDTFSSMTSHLADFADHRAEKFRAAYRLEEDAHEADGHFHEHLQTDLHEEDHQDSRFCL
jgi:hypothetical protein